MCRRLKLSELTRGNSNAWTEVDAEPSLERFPIFAAAACGDSASARHTRIRQTNCDAAQATQHSTSNRKHSYTLRRRIRMLLAMADESGINTDGYFAIAGYLGEDTEWTRNVRNSFSRYFSILLSNQQPAEHIPPHKREEFIRINARTVLSVGFSDSFVVSLPLQAVTTVPDYEDFARSATNLWHALLGLACMSLSALQQGIPLRGGIDVGLGTEMFPNEVYAPHC